MIKSRTFTPDCPVRNADLSLEEQQVVVSRIIEFIQVPRTTSEITLHVQERCGVALQESELKQLLQTQFQLSKLGRGRRRTSEEEEEGDEEEVEWKEGKGRDRLRKVFYWKVNSIGRKESGTQPEKKKGKENWEDKKKEKDRTSSYLMSHHLIFCATRPEVSFEVMLSEDNSETIQQDRRRLLPSDFESEQEVDFLSQLTQNDEDEEEEEEGGNGKGKEEDGSEKRTRKRKKKRKKEDASSSFASEEKRKRLREQLAWREQLLSLRLTTSST